LLSPWKNRILIGTTDVAMDNPVLEPTATDAEIEYLLKYAQKYLKGDPTRADILSAYAGIRPLVSNNPDGDTADISRDHSLLAYPSGLITIAGGKWTTYHKMAEDTINKATQIAKLDERSSVTEELKLHGYTQESDDEDPYQLYGSDARALHNIADKMESGDQLLHQKLPYYPAQIVWAIRKEQARTVEDVLARRTRSLLLDTRASMELAHSVSKIIANELDYDKEWIAKQVDAYKKLAKKYIVSS